MKVLGEMRRGLLFVVSAPAGTGKTTLVRMLQKEFSCVAQSISYTTRRARAKETPGKDYHFISKEEFSKKISDGEFLEHAQVYENEYGTSKKQIEELRAQGKHVVLVIDTQGALSLRKAKTEAVFIFILPPSMDALRQRLSSRGTENPAQIDERISFAKGEVDLAEHYDYRIINDQLQSAYEVLRSIFIAEEHKIRS